MFVREHWKPKYIMIKKHIRQVKEVVMETFETGLE